MTRHHPSQANSPYPKNSESHRASECGTTTHADTRPIQNTALFHSNFARHLIGLARHLQSTLMHTLAETHGHKQLKIGFEPYLSMLGRDGYRLTDIASWLAISKQACNQTANQIERLGYIERMQHASDGRAKMLALTTSGRQLVAQGAQILALVEIEYADIVGNNALTGMASCTIELAEQLELPTGPVDLRHQSNGQILGALLPRISTFMQRRLMTLTAEKGHSELTMAFAQVLPLIGNDGGRISQMARIQEVSKQAINATVNRLEKLNYVVRAVEPKSGKSSRVFLTETGQKLVADSVASVLDLEKEFSNILGKNNFTELKQCCDLLYRELQLEENIFASTNISQRHENTVDVRLLAGQLQSQLNFEQRQQLADLLLAKKTR